MPPPLAEPAPFADDDRQVGLVDGLLDQAPVVVVAQAAAGDLLGRHQGERHHVVAEATRRRSGLGLDLGLGVGQHAIALRLGLAQELLTLLLALLAALLAQRSASLRASARRVR